MTDDSIALRVRVDALEIQRRRDSEQIRALGVSILAQKVENARLLRDLEAWKKLQVDKSVTSFQAFANEMHRRAIEAEGEFEGCKAELESRELYDKNLTLRGNLEKILKGVK